MVFTNLNNPRSAVSRYGAYCRTLIKRGATLGANCTVVSREVAGKYAFAGAGAVVNHGVPAFARMLDIPEGQYGWMSRFGDRLELPLAGDSEAMCPNAGDRYVLGMGTCTLASQSMELVRLKTKCSTFRETINVRVERMIDALIARSC